MEITNLQKEYGQNDTARFRLYTRNKNWSPNIYSKVKSKPEVNIIPSASYMVYRSIDEKIVIPYCTGSTNHTRMSYDSSGSYFNLNMKLLEPGYMYGIKISIYDHQLSSYVEQPKTFKFRVNKNEY